MCSSYFSNCSYYLQFIAVKYHVQWITAVQTRLQSLHCTFTAVWLQRLAVHAHLKFRIILLIDPPFWIKVAWLMIEMWYFYTFHEVKITIFNQLKKHFKLTKNSVFGSQLAEKVQFVQIYFCEKNFKWFRK